VNVSGLEGDLNTLIRIWIQQLNLLRIRIHNRVSTVTNKVNFRMAYTRISDQRVSGEPDNGKVYAKTRSPVGRIDTVPRCRMESWWLAALVVRHFFGIVQI
jgi:hypothetical protein